MFASNRNSAWENVVTDEHDGSAAKDGGTEADDPVFTFQDEGNRVPDDE